MLEFHSSVLSAAVILYRDGFQMTAKKLHDSLCNFILMFFKDETMCFCSQAGLVSLILLSNLHWVGGIK